MVFVYTSPNNLEIIVSTGYGLIYILSVGALGYLINDYFDTEEDRLANRVNYISQFSCYRLLLLVILFLTIAILPFVFYPLCQPHYFIFLIAQLLCFILYSVPPFRLKNNMFGLLADSLYSFLLPGLIVISLGFDFSKTYVIQISLLVLFIVWLFLLGWRSIILHQVKDVNKDIKSGNITFTIKVGVENAVVLAWIALILESIVFVVLCCLIDFYLWIYVLCSVILFFLIEGVLNHNLKMPSYDLKNVTGSINNYYNTYLICGISVLAAVEVHHMFFIIAPIIIILRIRTVFITLLKQFYHKVILYVYYKTLGVLRLLRK